MALIENDIPNPPPELAWPTFILVGEQWPGISEKAVSRDAESNRNLAGGLSDVINVLRLVKGALKDAGQGPSLDEAINYISKLIEGPETEGSDVIPQLQKGLKDVADALDEIAMQVQYTKIVIILMAAYLLYTIVNLIYLAIVTDGIAEALMEPIIEMYQKAAEEILAELFKRILFGMVFMLALDSAAQGVQMILGSRKEWDGKQSFFMTMMGGLGAAVEFIAGGIAFKLFGHNYLSHIASSAVSEAITETIGSAIQHQDPDISYGGSTLGGLFSGATDAIVEHPTELLHQKHRFGNLHLPGLTQHGLGPKIETPVPPHLELPTTGNGQQTPAANVPLTNTPLTQQILPSQQQPVPTNTPPTNTPPTNTPTNPDASVQTPLTQTPLTEIPETEVSQTQQSTFGAGVGTGGYTSPV